MELPDYGAVRSTFGHLCVLDPKTYFAQSGNMEDSEFNYRVKFNVLQSAVHVLEFTVSENTSINAMRSH